ncbi:AraC family transcriptional regulator [Coraliomargarita algicola]|uniref:AraC family transcriptional regulator n=1 Tax=Coraliomargarita algicola TaxID=3092156 RepID=A0ABZ0RKK1_9BACT|nr:AraC family transcriptional regulator [Coraliomargarita sp. J2-16]WPJ95530.1 AraC family transcriptional regulator [Coraliomargarita sp. J2-16]
MMGQMDSPNSLFEGLLLSKAATPDNIILFQRTDTAAFRPEGVSNNFHHRFELVCAIDGGGPVRIGDHTYQFEPGDCGLIPPNQFHHYMDVEAPSLNWLFITFEMAHSDCLQPLFNSPRQLDAESILLLQNTLLPYLTGGAETENVIEIAFHLSRFLSHMHSLPTIPPERCNINATDDSRDIILERINRYVRAHLTESPTIADLAEALGYSVSHLRAVFRDRLGVSLGRYIRESRLSEAAKLLKETNLNVTEVSQRTGFDSLFAFSRAFKNTYGIPPKAYSQKVGHNTD